VFVLTGAFLLACLPLGCGRKPAPEEAKPPAPVKWMEARQLFPEEWTELLGTTQPLPGRAARITAPVEGEVVSVLQGPNGKTVVEGQEVKKGDVIARLDASLVKANRDKLKATLKKLKDQEKQAKVAVDLAQLEVTRLKKLKATITVAESDIQKAELLLKDAQYKQEAVKTDQEAGQAELEALDVQVGLYTLTAPIDGQLGRILVVPGQTLPPGTSVADVINLKEQIDVLCFVPPHIAKRLQKGQPARIGGLDEPAQGSTAGAEGKVEFIADQAEVDSGNFAVKVRFPNKQLGLRVNTTLRIRILTVPGKACLTLPEEALLEDQDPPAVIVVEDYKKEKIKVMEQGKEKEKEIETGIARKLRVKVGVRDRVLHVVEIISVDDPEKKWKGSLETSKFVVQKGQGLQTGDAIKLEEEEEEGE
jgi:multidrug efflux system membrane fusion protein